MNISVVGGDKRTVELVKLLEKDKHEICLFGLGKSEELSNFKHASNLEEALQNADLIITSIPLSKDGKKINAVFTEKTILIEDFFQKAKNTIIVTGNITDEISKYIRIENHNKIIDVMKEEELTIKNAIPTAEGAIQIAMEKSNITIHNSKCLVLGFGRIGKLLSKMLSGIGAKVYCEARKQQDLAWIQAYGYNPIHLKNIDRVLNQFDFIFNTIPYVIIDKQRLEKIKKECILIDLASKPGGIDFNQAKEMNLQVECALALPGKVAPKTAAEYIYEIIAQLI
ncbi:MAG: dipicolinate synthase subunit DpsA [Clostridia bacterium]|nr:dipicolinate synthase subunit DpsA [Clostridia bacterium]